MQAVLTGLQKDLGITFVYVTHSQSEAFAMADRVVIMSRGRVEQIGTPKDIFFEPHNRFVAEFVGGKNMLGGVVLGFDDTGLVQLDSAYGRFLARLPEDRSVAVGEEVTLCISAEHINLAAQPTTASRLACTVMGRNSLGQWSTYTEAANGLELQVQKPYADYDLLGLKSGQRVHVGGTMRGR